MAYSSIIFLFYFLPATVSLYFLAPRFLKNPILLLASLVFYAWGDVRYIPLLLTSIFINYLCGFFLQHRTALVNKAVLAIGITFNVSLLCAFKYTNFLAETINPLLVLLGLQPFADTSIALPMGISFFTFHNITYLVDVYRSDAAAKKNFLSVALYIALFPKLIAGPIIPFRDIQCALRKRIHSMELFVKGCKLFIVGLSLKVIIADILANPVNAIYSISAEHLSPSLAWAASIFYTFQIYFDFWGYSTMAIGLGYMFGFTIPQNFNSPYVSGSITEFWRRWHITLTSWFRNYLYIPLGGNRKGRFKEYRNLIIVFFLCGLWHGASWMFILWGLYHGTFIIIERLFFKNVLNRIPPVIRTLWTFIIINIGWVLFRSVEIETCKQMLEAMLLFENSGQRNYLLSQYLGNDVLIAFLLAVVFSIPIKYYGNFFKKHLPFFVIKTPVKGYGWYSFFAENAPYVILLLLIAMNLSAKTYKPFIYFQF